MFLCVYQGDKPLDTLRQWLKTYGRELDQEARQDCSETEKLLKRALAGAGEELFSNLGEFGFMYWSCHIYRGTVLQKCKREMNLKRMWYAHSLFAVLSGMCNILFFDLTVYCYINALIKVIELIIVYFHHFTRHDL